MSQSVVVLGPSRTAPSAFGVRNATARQVPGDGQAIQLTGELGGARWYITVREPPNPKLFIDEYAENEDLDGEFRGAAATLSLVVFDFNRLEPIRELLVEFLRGVGERAKAYWLDTDYGWVIRGDRLLEHVSDDPSWDWRFDPYNSAR